MVVKHAFTNPQADGGDATITRPSDWNANHLLVGPYGNYHPDRYPASGLTLSDEFDDSSLDGAWGWTTAPAGTVSESQFPGFLHIDGGTDNAAATHRLKRSFVPGATAFSVATKVSMSMDNGNFTGALGISLLTSADANIWALTYGTDGSATASDGMRVISTPATFGGSTIGTLHGFMYLLITRDGSGVYNGYMSRDGIVWMRVGGSTTATAVDRVCISWAADTDAVNEEGLIDFVRVFSSITRKIGA